VRFPKVKESDKGARPVRDTETDLSADLGGSSNYSNEIITIED